MGPRALRDIQAAQAAGQFDERDLNRVMVLVTGSMIELGHPLHDRPDLNAATLIDGVTCDLLVALGMDRQDAERTCAAALPDLSTLATGIANASGRSTTT